MLDFPLSVIPFWPYHPNNKAFVFSASTLRISIPKVIDPRVNDLGGHRVKLITQSFGIFFDNKKVFEPENVIESDLIGRYRQ